MFARPPGSDMPGLPMQYQKDGVFVTGEESIVRFWRANGQAIWGMQYDVGLFTGAARRVH